MRIFQVLDKIGVKMTIGASENKFFRFHLGGQNLDHVFHAFDGDHLAIVKSFAMAKTF